LTSESVVQGSRQASPDEGGTLAAETMTARATTIEWVLFDVDGVLTDGRLVYGADGEQLKVFDVRDGLGFMLARRAGLKIGLLTGRASRALDARAAEIGADAVLTHRLDKHAAFRQFLADHGTTADRVAYVGDDLVDLPVLLVCGLSFAPADADDEVRRRVHSVLARRGGRGAAREVIEIVLRARGDWDRLLADFLPPA
jgi:3-deoxy-D-manno-octulosonate 8-phosphate phosphatase (KDO 8-P phosphatase)